MLDPATARQPDRYVIWFAANGLLTAAEAWVAFQIQQEGIAPAVLFPLLVGTVLGTGGLAVLRFTRVPGVRVAICGAAIWGLLVVIGQDYIGHRHHLRLYDDTLGRQQSSLAALVAHDPQMRPGFGDYLAGKMRMHPVWWSLDLVLTSGATALVTALGASGKQLPTSGE
jgi:hypothetical protein